MNGKRCRDRRRGPGGVGLDRSSFIAGREDVVRKRLARETIDRFQPATVRGEPSPVRTRPSTDRSGLLPGNGHSSGNNPSLKAASPLARAGVMSRRSLRASARVFLEKWRQFSFDAADNKRAYHFDVNENAFMVFFKGKVGPRVTLKPENEVKHIDF